MNTNLPLVPRTSDGPTWSNGWAATSARLDMIAKQYKNGTRTGVERGKNRFGTGSRMGLERGKKRVGMGAKTGFKRQKNGISPNYTLWNGVERPFFAVPHLSTVFLPFQPFLHPFLTIFAKNGKKRSSKNGGTGKERTRSFQFLSRSVFFPFPFQEHLYRGRGSSTTSEVCWVFAAMVTMSLLVPIVDRPWSVLFLHFLVIPWR